MGIYLLEGAASNTVSSVVTGEMVNGVLNEVIGLLPVVLPAMIGFLAIRKGVSFVLSMLRSA